MSDILHINNLSHDYGEGLVFKDVSLHLQPQQLLTILGESGCGKTTLLRDIVGLQTPKSGEIQIHNKYVFSVKKAIDIPPTNRDVGLVFQEYALFPALTVSQNIVFGLHKVDRAEKAKRLEELLEGMGIVDIRHRFPHEISGGQQQRVALARSMAPNPKLILLDEPFANLDQPRTQQLFLDIKNMLQEINAAAILITHDHQDALAFSDKIAVFEKKPKGGPAYFAQIDSPQNIYHQPLTENIAKMFGPCNILEGEYKDGSFQTKFGNFITSRSHKQKCLLIREADVEVEEVQEKSDFRCIHSFFLGENYRVICKHISGSIIIGLSKKPIKTAHVHVRFLNKEDVWSV